MKAVMTFSSLVLLVAVAGCSARPSPEASVTCSEATTLTFSGAAGSTTDFVVSKGVLMNDQGLGGAVPANGIEVDIISPSGSVTVCPGECAGDAASEFDESIVIVTDDNAVLKYTARLSADGGSFTGSISEVFNALSSCSTAVSITTGS